MADLNAKKVFLLSKIEGAYGVDPTPVDTDAVETRGLAITRYDGDRISNTIDRSTLGGYSEINVGPRSGLTFNVGMQGSGAAATATAYGALLRACGLLQTIGGSSVTYAPVSSGYESVTAYHFMDGMRQILKGVRANVTGTLGRGVLPVWGFNLQGLYNTPTTPACVTPNITDFFDPIPVTKTNTPTLTIAGYSGAKLEQFTFDLGNQITYLNTTNYEGLDITDRNVTGTISIAAPDLATKNFFTNLESHTGVTTAAFQLIHGTVAGKIVQIDGSKVQISTISDSNQDNRGIYTFGLKFLPTSGNDEILITTK